MTRIVREYVFPKSKKRDFLRFFEAAFKKRKKLNPKFEVSDFADFSLAYMESPLQLKNNVGLCL